MRPFKVIRYSVGVLFLLILAGLIVLLSAKTSETIEAGGVVTLDEVVYITHRWGGILESVYVEKGDQVDKGGVLAVLADDVFRAERDRAERLLEEASERLEAARRELDALKGRTAVTEKELAREKVVKTRIRVEQLGRELSSRETLFDKGIASENEVKILEAELEMARSDLRMAEKNLELMKAGKEMAQDEAGYRLEKAKRDYRQAEDDLRLAREMLDSVTVKAPVPGTVLEVTLNEGRKTTAGDPFIILASTENVVFIAGVPGRDVPHIKEGQSVDLYIDAFPFRKYGSFDGKVVRISPGAERGGSGSLFSVEISIDDPWIELPEEAGGEEVGRFPLKPGFTGRAKIIIEKDVRLVEMIFNYLRKA